MPPSIALGPVAKALLAKRHPARGKAATAAELTALLAKHKVARHPPAQAFERAYGDLLIPDHGFGAGWRKSEPAWAVGAGACLQADLTFPKPGKHQLVPVIYTSNDNAFFLDATGAAWAQDTIEDPRPVRFAADARAMLTKILVQEYAFLCPEEKRLVASGRFGKPIAAALGARPLADASDAKVAWWTDGKLFIVERDGDTTVTYATKAQQAKARAAAGLPKPGPPAPLGTDFMSVLNQGSSVGVALPDVLGSLDAVWSAFLTAHGSQPVVGAPIAFGPGGALRGTVTAVDAPPTREGGGRLQLELTGSGALARCFKRRKATRVEVFFRDYIPGKGKTFVNVFHFDVTDAAADTIQQLWWDVMTPWAAVQGKPA